MGIRPKKKTRESELETTIIVLLKVSKVPINKLYLAKQSTLQPFSPPLIVHMLKSHPPYNCSASSDRIGLVLSMIFGGPVQAQIISRNKALCNLAVYPFPFYPSFPVRCLSYYTGVFEFETDGCSYIIVALPKAT